MTFKFTTGKLTTYVTFTAFVPPPKRSDISRHLLALAYAEAVADLAPEAAKLRELCFLLAVDRCTSVELKMELAKMLQFSTALLNHTTPDDTRTSWVMRRHHAVNAACVVARSSDAALARAEMLRSVCVFDINSPEVGTLDAAVPFGDKEAVAQWDNILRAARLFRAEVEIVSL